MAATAWSFYNSFREYLGEGDFDLSGTSVGFKMALHTSAASALVNTATLSTQASLANEVANGNGYTTGGAFANHEVWVGKIKHRQNFQGRVTENRSVKAAACAVELVAVLNLRTGLYGGSPNLRVKLATH